MADARARSEKTRPSLWWLLGGVVVPFIRIVSTLKIRDGAKLPTTGPFILTPNHQSNIDPLVMAVVVWRLGRAPRFLAKASLFRVPVVGALFRAVGQIPVERGGLQRGAIPLEAAKRVVDEGHCVIVYPEGSLTRDPHVWPMRGKTGAARLALDLDIPVIPVAHWGTQDLMPRYSKTIHVLPRATIEVLFGDPVDLSEWRGKPVDGASLQEATTRIMDAITGLLEQLRGQAAPVERWDPAKHGQTEIGRF